jgi:RNA polymerase sigma factor (sigma-70 family)
MSLVYAVCERVNNYKVPREDIHQIGMIGLIKAVDRFDPGKGVAFSTYAWKLIHGEVLQYLRDKADLIRTPRGKKSLQIVELTDMIEPCAPDPDELSEIDNVLKIADKVLPRRSRRVFHAIASGQELDQAALAFGVSKKAILNSMTGSKKRIREALALGGRP